MKLLCSDYDGTLCTQRKIRQEDIEAVRRFREKGNRFAVITGRCWGIIIDELNDVGLPFDYLVCSNGAVTAHGDYLKRETIDPIVARKILDYLRSENVMDFGISDGVQISQHTYETGELDSRFYCPNYPLLPADQIINNGVVCSFFTAYRNHDEAVRYGKILNELFGQDVRVVASDAISIDIAPKGVTKLNGIDHILQQEEFDSIYTIGDSPNDIEMLQAFEGFGMATGDLQIMPFCKHVVNSVAECIQIILNSSQ